MNLEYPLGTVSGLLLLSTSFSLNFVFPPHFMTQMLCILSFLLRSLAHFLSFTRSFSWIILVKIHFIPYFIEDSLNFTKWRRWVPPYRRTLQFFCILTKKFFLHRLKKKNMCCMSHAHEHLEYINMILFPQWNIVFMGFATAIRLMLLDMVLWAKPSLVFSLSRSPSPLHIV